MIYKELFVVFADFVVDSGVRLIAIDLPRNPTLSRIYDSSFDLEHETFMRRQANDIGFTYISRQEIPEFGSSDFCDFAHMNDAGRSKMSKFLKQYLDDLTIKKK